MSVIIEKFDKVCDKYKERTAFYFIKNNEIIEKSFDSLMKDVEKVSGLLYKKGVRKNHRIIVLTPPSYDLVIFMLSCIKIGASIMYVDIWANSKLIQSTFDKYRPDFIAYSRKTYVIKWFFKHFKNVKKGLFVDKLLETEETLKFPKEKIDDDNIALLTMTTGSTGDPKIVLRSHKDLYQQLSLINKNMDESKHPQIVLTTAFMYSFSNLLNGYSTVLPQVNLGNPFKFLLNRKLKKFSKLDINTIITSPDFCIDTKNFYSNLKKLYIGGAILNYNETKKIIDNYPNVDITYIYGSTECNIITKTNLSDYMDRLENLECAVLGSAVDGVKIRTNKNDEIMVSSDALLNNYLDVDFSNKESDEHGVIWHKTGDLGRYKDNKLVYYGRKNIYIVDKDKLIHSNPLEQKLVRKFDSIKKCAFFNHKGKNHLFIQGKKNINEEISRYINDLGLSEDTIIWYRNKIPCDVKHHTKINYRKLKQIVDRKLK
ncbi:MAG: class I adenylate-forming enzyme family protein [Tissierellia bacterium]|nr:class I adenylate-forming enzyme family protein [Tissierellia bacterium]